ncbi:cell division protein FtsB [Aurantivibrio plasticivorans]
MKWLVAALAICIVYLQYRLWIGEGSIAEVVSLQDQIKQQYAEIDNLKERNRLLSIEVEELKTGLKTIEERARSELGMIKDGETLYIVVDEEELQRGLPSSSHTQ